LEEEDKEYPYVHQRLIKATDGLQAREHCVSNTTINNCPRVKAHFDTSHHTLGARAMAVPSLLGFLNLHEMGLHLAPDFEEFVE
jgi:hypothetical protein